MCRTASFVEECKRASEGTTNRVRWQEDKFLAREIPLPPLAERRRVVARNATLSLPAFGCGYVALNRYVGRVVRRHRPVACATHTHFPSRLKRKAASCNRLSFWPVLMAKRAPLQMEAPPNSPRLFRA